MFSDNIKSESAKLKEMHAYCIGFSLVHNFTVTKMKNCVMSLTLTRYRVQIEVSSATCTTALVVLAPKAENYFSSPAYPPSSSSCIITIK